MMGRLSHDQGEFFYSFRLDEAVPDDHPVRAIAAVLDLSWVHAELTPFYPKIGRPSIDPVLMIRMLIVGYAFAIRSERALCREMRVNLAYRWFCGLSIEDKIPDHSAFSRIRHERFRESDMFRRIFERVVEACIAAGLVGGEGFAIDASLIQADANNQRSMAGAADFCNKSAKTGSRCLLDHLVGAGDESRRDFEPDCLGSAEVDHKIETGGLVKGDLSRPDAFQNLRNLAGNPAVDVRKIDRISHQSPGLDEFAIRIECGNPAFRRQFDERDTIAEVLAGSSDTMSAST